MTNATITQTAQEAKELFDIIMDLYSQYLNTLEIYVSKIPDSETGILNDLNAHMVDVQNALEHDISIFENALNSDKQDLQMIKDQLKINDIYKMLKNG